MTTSFPHSKSNSIVVIEFGDGKLNTLGGPTRHAIHQQLEAFRSDASVRSIILMGRGGKNFSAGADMTEFTNPDVVADVLSLTALCLYVESYPKPVVAAIAGAALGGGLELAMACHYRVCCADRSATLGLPEVRVGVVPGAGGTQRLPRLVGAAGALRMITAGTPLAGTAAVQAGLADGACPGDQPLLDCAAEWASRALGLPTLPRTRDIVLDDEVVQAACDAAMSKLPPADHGGFGMHAAVKAVRASSNFEEGSRVEQQAFWDTLANPQGQARRHAFFAVRAAQKGVPLPPGTQPAILHQISTTKVGVIGAGLMGSGIGLVLLQAGYEVRLVDISDQALQKGVEFLKYTIMSNVKRGKWSKEEAASIQKRLHPTTSLQDLKDCRLVVEAVVEVLAVKKNIFATLDQVVQAPDALLLSNTSTLSIDAIASALSPNRRTHCAGWHYFSPAHKMPLVEIVVGKDTSQESTSILQALTKRIGKTGVTVGNCHGFVGNRMVAPYSGEACFLVAGGLATVQAVDDALRTHFGMAMGPFQMGDLAGNDIGYSIRKEQGLTRDPNTGRVGPNRGNQRYTELPDDMVTELGRLGQKAGKGWYDYDPKVGKGRIGVPSPEVTEFCKRYHSSDAPPPPLNPKAIIERVLFPLVNEGFKILEEGMAQRPSDIDVVYLYGYGWPVWRGGPMFWANSAEVGLPYLLQNLKEWYSQHPNCAWFKPSALLEKCVSQNMTVEEYCKHYKKMHSKL